MQNFFTYSHACVRILILGVCVCVHIFAHGSYWRIAKLRVCGGGEESEGGEGGGEGGRVEGARSRASVISHWQTSYFNVTHTHTHTQIQLVQLLVRYYIILTMHIIITHIYCKWSNNCQKFIYNSTLKLINKAVPSLSIQNTYHGRSNQSGKQCARAKR